MAWRNSVPQIIELKLVYKSLGGDKPVSLIYILYKKPSDCEKRDNK